MKKAKLSSQIDLGDTNSYDLPQAQAGTLICFASVGESVAATSKRTSKAALLGSYFTSLSDKDLAHAARYFAGYIFPLRDQQTSGFRMINSRKPKRPQFAYFLES